MKERWIITIANEKHDGIIFTPFEGTEDEVRAQLVAMVKEDRLNDCEGWCYGTEAAKEVCNQSDYTQNHSEIHKLYAFGAYRGYGIDYVAAKVADMFPEAISMQTPAGELICTKSGAGSDYPGLQITLRKEKAESTVAVVEYSDGNMVTSAYAWEGDEPVQTIKW